MTLRDDIAGVVSSFHNVAESTDGLRVPTDCVYPSFDPVHVYLSRGHSGFRVDDAGNAFRSAWAHGRDERLIGRHLEAEAARYQLKVDGVTLSTTVPNIDWVMSAIIAVANASSAAAHASVARFVAVAESSLRERIDHLLAHAVTTSYSTAKEYAIRGKSGKEHRFDFAIAKNNQAPILLIDAVAPHHVSIASKYVAFSDVKAADDRSVGRFAVFEKRLPVDDAALMEQVADLVPLSSLEQGAIRAMRA